MKFRLILALKRLNRLQNVMRLGQMGTILALVVTFVGSPTRLAAAVETPFGATTAEQTLVSFFDAMKGREFEQVIARQLIEHFFVTPDAVDAVVIYTVSRMRSAGFDRQTIIGYDIDSMDLDDDYGYATAQVRIRGNWWFIVPTSALMEVRLRRIDGIWQMLPPPLTNLDEFVD